MVILMKTKTVKQKVTFKATPHDVYELIMDSRKHSMFSGSKARITKKVGSKFSTYDGYIDGVNLKLVPDKEIVQSWRGSEWPKGHYSKARFSFKKIKDGTVLTFTQTGVPEESYNAINKGWVDHYWNPMKEILKK